MNCEDCPLARLLEECAEGFEAQVLIDVSNIWAMLMLRKVRAALEGRK